MMHRPAIFHILLAAAGTLMATGAIAQDSPPQPTSLSETYDSWTVQCATPQQEGQPAKRQCQMSQELLQQDSRQRMFLFAVSKPDGNPHATLVLPFGLLLSEGIRLEIAQKELLRAQFRTCLPAGCIVEIELPEETIAQLQSGETVSVLMTAMNNQPV